MGIHIEKTDAGSLIALRGAIDIACAAELKAVLLDALNTEGGVRISLDGATYLDVTAIQLLWAAEQQARRSGGTFRIEGHIPEAVSTGVADAGFSSFFASVHAVTVVGGQECQA
jgi:anti-anti-sigma factor